MSSLRNLITRVFVYSKFKGQERLMIGDTKKHYSVFPSTMLKPTYKHSEQKELDEASQLKILALKEIKPAFSDDTCSEFHDHLVAKFTNYLMTHGRKESSNNLMQKTFASIKRIQIERYHKAETPEERSEIMLDPLKIFYNSIKNVTPVLELKRMTRGGATYQVPHPLTENRAKFLAMKWLKENALTKERTTHMWDALAQTICDASDNEGPVVKRKLELHKQCEANRAFAHFRWS